MVYDYNIIYNLIGLKSLCTRRIIRHFMFLYMVANGCPDSPALLNYACVHRLFYPFPLYKSDPNTCLQLVFNKFDSSSGNLDADILGREGNFRESIDHFFILSATQTTLGLFSAVLKNTKKIDPFWNSVWPL